MGVFLVTFMNYFFMNLNDRISAFAELGHRLREGLEGKGEFAGQLGTVIDNQHINNPWFTPDNVRMAVGAIAGALTKSGLEQWTSAYPHLQTEVKPMTVAVIMAGNIPAVGFHDMLSVLISGNNLLAKTSARDTDLINLFSEILCHINGQFRGKISVTDAQVTGFDAVIATGSDNSARYFEYYFGKYPSIIRRNRNSLAILEGNETDKELEDLGKDVFSYFGLGCRNVSKVYVPRGYDMERMIRSWEKFGAVISHSKYAGNYDFNKAVYLVNKEPFLDTGHLLIKKDSRLSSPVAVLYWDDYSSRDELAVQTEALQKKIQCIAGYNYLPFGTTQYPDLWDYADGVDTLLFLSEKKISGNILL